MSEFHEGQMVKIVGESRSTYRVYDDKVRADGSILLYGGDKNPNGVQGFRSVMPSRVRAIPVRGKKA